MSERESKKAALVDASKVREFGFQVAGHPGVLEVEGDGMIIKPQYQRELEFYEGSGSCPELCSFMPTFYGSLEHAGETSQTDSSSGEPSPAKRYICLENLVHGFKEPCVVDVKIGVRLYDIDASPEKRERTIKQANRTTSGRLGIAITGMRVHGQPAVDRDWCRDLTPTTLVDAFEMYFSSAAQCISVEYRRQVIQQFVEELKELNAAIERTETRMYSSSVFFIYEASKERYESLVAKDKGDSEDSSDDDDGGGALVNMKMIDFAHSHWTPGQGRDDNYIAGISKLVEIFGTLIE
ncbi:hypothetical protein EV175_005060 [Coemansia sp. RSA 1933]|nr:hypothetical protein EV175_005060 [Coemansia sp. RSA 1933]